MKKKKIIAITGIRSEYFLQQPVLRATHESAALELRLIVTGAHLSPIHGYTIQHIERDGFPILERIDSLLWTDRLGARVKGAAIQFQQLAPILERENPDWVIAPCDREEAMVMAMCATYLNIPIVHLGAGDRVVGNVDDMIRHAVSRVSHLLLAFSDASKDRLIRSGEQAFRVVNIGHPGIDRLKHTPEMSRQALREALGIPFELENYLVVIQHAISSEISQAERQMEETMKAVHMTGLPAIVIRPNSDPGSEGIIAAMTRQAEKNKKILLFDTLTDEIFVNVMRNAFALVGNSSMGLLEAPFLKLPVINVGNRQKQRQHSDNVVFLPHDAGRIKDQIVQWLEDEAAYRERRDCFNPFGDGSAGEKAARLLETLEVTPEFMNKDLTF